MIRAGMKRAGVVAALALLSACASAPPAATAAEPGAMGGNPADPWEAWNRKVFAFNDALDNAVFKPVAQAYRDTVPALVRAGVSNFFGNIGDVWSAANQFLQGKVGTGLEMSMRVLTNTLFGLGGLLDPATEMRLTRRSEDFGQTLGVWGLPAGPYLVLPLFGPSSVRDAAGLAPDSYAGSTGLYFDVNVWATSALQLVNVRADLLTTTQFLSDIALDHYSFMRDAYLARRHDLVWDGAPPLEKMDDDWDDPEAPPSKKGN
jgi:phospholipid-binding lipoprotein MlaA